MEHPTSTDASDSPLTLPFVMHLVLTYLNKTDVLTGLVLVNKLLKQPLSNYLLVISERLLQDATSPNRYLPLVITGVIDVKNLNMVRRLTSQSLKTIIFHDYFNTRLYPGSIHVIPSSVTHLTFGAYFNQTIYAGVLPSSITHLTFGAHFDQRIPTDSIPFSVTHLTFGEMFNQVFANMSIPSSVTHLTFGNSFNQPITAGSIPSLVTNLTFGEKFNQPISDGSIPSSLIQLTLGNEFNHDLTDMSIPSSVSVVRHPKAVVTLRTLEIDYNFGQTFADVSSRISSSAVGASRHDSRVI